MSRVTDRWGKGYGNSLKKGAQDGDKAGALGTNRSLFVFHKPLWGESYVVPMGPVSGLERDVSFLGPCLFAFCLSSPPFWGLLKVGAWF